MPCRSAEKPVFPGVSRSVSGFDAVCRRLPGMPCFPEGIAVSGSPNPVAYRRRSRPFLPDGLAHTQASSEGVLRPGEGGGPFLGSP
jgi:hypothetical protein